MLRTGGKDILQGRLPQVRMIKIMVIMIRGRAQIILIMLIMPIMMMMIMLTLCRANDVGDDDEFQRFFGTVG